MPTGNYAIGTCGCGCTECLVGKYIPVENGAREHLVYGMAPPAEAIFENLRD